MIEAAQHGVPTVAFSSAGGVRDSIVDGVTGRLVADGESFTDAVIETMRGDYGEAARLWAGRFSWEETGRRFEQVLEEVVADSAK